MSVPNDFISANLVMIQCYARLVQLDVLPTEKLAQLETIISGLIHPVRVSEFFEFGYANRDDLDEVEKVAFADVGYFATENGFLGLATNGRGAAMETILRGAGLPEGVEPPEPSPKWSPLAPPAFMLGVQPLP